MKKHYDKFITMLFKYDNHGQWHPHGDDKEAKDFLDTLTAGEVAAVIYMSQRSAPEIPQLVGDFILRNSGGPIHMWNNGFDN